MEYHLHTHTHTLIGQGDWREGCKNHGGERGYIDKEVNRMVGHAE